MAKRFRGQQLHVNILLTFVRTLPWSSIFENHRLGHLWINFCPGASVDTNDGSLVSCSVTFYAHESNTKWLKYQSQSRSKSACGKRGPDYR